LGESAVGDSVVAVFFPNWPAGKPFDEVGHFGPPRRWSQEVMKLTNGQGVDHIVEVGGHIALIRVLTGVQGKVPTAAFMTRQARLQALIVGNRHDRQEFIAHWNRLVSARLLIPLLPLKNWLRLLLTNRLVNTSAKCVLSGNLNYC